MADISMCEGKNCPKKDNCYRVHAKPNPWRQAYFAPTPTEKGCEYYIPFRPITPKS